ncbi:MAG: rubrerythrin family protein [Crenarchaeota archaeon]|nr:rubrerythrin family protein [Thermoproteota archaeon]
MYKDEVETSIIYRELSKYMKDPKISQKLLELSEVEKSHADFWRSFLEKRGVDPDKIRISRTALRLKIALFKVLGYGLTLKILELGEDEAIKSYSKLLSSPELSEDEKQRLRKILEDELVHEEEFEEEESRLKSFLMHVRDAILGMNDGLVEILSVSAGLAGAYGDPIYVALGGSIVGIGGALSMAVGTYISVKAQRDVKLGTLERIKLAARYATNILVERVKASLLKRGYSRDAVDKIGEDARANPDILSKIVAEEEYGISEESIENPRIASLYTGIFYIIGAFVPLIPYFLGLPILYALILSFLMAASMLAVSGTIVAISSGLAIKRKVVELVLSGLGSALATYGIGALASLLFGIHTG